MATVKSEVQAASALTMTGMTTAPGTRLYSVSADMNHATNDPLDVLVEVTALPSAAASGNKQLVIFAKASADGTNFSTGPESGTDTTDEGDLYFVGVLPMATATATTHKKTFSLANAFGGVLPKASRLVIKNDCGQTLTSGSVQIAEVWGVVA